MGEVVLGGTTNVFFAPAVPAVPEDVIPAEYATPLPSVPPVENEKG